MFTFSCAGNSCSTCATHPYSVPHSLLQTESGASLLKLLVFKCVSVRGMGWSLTEDAADRFGWGMCTLNIPREVMCLLYLCVDFVDKTRILGCSF